MEEATFHCPVCGFGHEGTAEDNYQEICVCCGTQFGYHDATKSHELLRQKWISNGMRWSSQATDPPTGWNPKEQLENLNS